jgi:alkylated DNA nucleotide flippase Atl1
MAKKTYTQKLHTPSDRPKIVELDEKGEKRFGGKMMVVPKPTDICDIMRKVPQGKLITTSEIRKIISEKYHTDTACPLTTGIFVNICAHASVENDDNLPYWRTLKTNGELNPKFPNAPEEQIALLESEGFTILKKGRKNIKYFVKDYDKYLVTDL